MRGRSAVLADAWSTAVLAGGDDAARAAPGSLLRLRRDEPVEVVADAAAVLAPCTTRQTIAQEC